MFQRFKNAITQAGTTMRGLRRDEKGVVMVEWVALAGVFVAVVAATFITIGEDVDAIVTEVDEQTSAIVSSLPS